jgi:hypothetical protein
MGYVVYLLGSDDLKPFRYFETPQVASEYARNRVETAEAERAEIYEVPDATGSADAIAAVRIGAANLIESHGEGADESAPQDPHESGGNPILKYLGFR